MQTVAQVFLEMFEMRFISRQAARIGIIVITTGILGAIGHASAQNLDLNSFLAPVQGGSDTVQGDVEGAIPREQMLVGFFRAMAGLDAPSTRS